MVGIYANFIRKTDASKIISQNIMRLKVMNWKYDRNHQINNIWRWGRGDIVKILHFQNYIRKSNSFVGFSITELKLWGIVAHSIGMICPRSNPEISKSAITRSVIVVAVYYFNFWRLYFLEFLYANPTSCLKIRKKILVGRGEFNLKGSPAHKKN